MSQVNNNEIFSSGISNYMLNDIRVNTESVFPNDPSIKYQNSGLYKNKSGDFIDVNSEILNITRPLTDNAEGKWMGGKLIDDVELKESKFSSRYSRLDEPAFELRGQTKNRWIELPIDPQENAIEPFQRLGTNTHLANVDLYNC